MKRKRTRFEIKRRKSRLRTKARKPKQTPKVSKSGIILLGKVPKTHQPKVPRPIPHEQHIPWKYQTKVQLSASWNAKPEIKRARKYLEERPIGTEFVIRGLTIRLNPRGNLEIRKYVEPEILERIRDGLDGMDVGFTVRHRGVLFTKTENGISAHLPETKLKAKAKKKIEIDRRTSPIFGNALQKVEKPGDLISGMRAGARKAGIKFISRPDLYMKLNLTLDQAFMAEVDALTTKLKPRNAHTITIETIARQNLQEVRFRNKHEEKRSKPEKKKNLAFSHVENMAKKPGALITELQAEARDAGLKTTPRKALYIGLKLTYLQAFAAEVDALRKQYKGDKIGSEEIWQVAERNLKRMSSKKK